MFLLFKRINIFLLSFFLIFAPVTNFAYAIDPIVPPFTSAPAAADVAAALGAGESGGFAAGLAGVGIAAAAIGVGVGSFCLASAIQGANSCGVNSAICNALTGAMISCTPNSDGSFNKNTTTSTPTPPSDSGIYYYKMTAYGYKGGYAPISTLFAYLTSVTKDGTCGIKLTGITVNPTTEPYDKFTFYTPWSGSDEHCGYETYLHSEGLDRITQTHTPPAPPAAQKAQPDDVGKAIAGNPAAAAALGAAAAAAANSGCNGTLGTFNGVSTCVPALGPSNNPSCSGFYGQVNGQSVCVPALGTPSTNGCAGYYGSVNNVELCMPQLPTSSACNGKLASYDGNPVCIGGSDTSANNPANALTAAQTAAAVAALHPPASRTCAPTMKLDPTSKICVNTALPAHGNGDCKIGYVFSVNTCVPADPLNPSLPATTTPLTPAQVAAHAQASAAATSLTQARANAQAATAAAAANPADQTKAAASVAAAAALQQATLDAVAANTAATAEATAQPKPMELPAFCGWAAIVCDAISWAKTDAKAPTDTAVTVKSDIPSEIQNLDINKSYFNFGAQCPADVPVTFSLMGKSTTLNIKYTLVCDFLSKLRPFVIGSAWIAGAFIISGASRSGGGDS